MRSKLKYRIIIIVGLALPIVLVQARPQKVPTRTHAEVDGLALTPPMGWYPWNMFGEEPQNEKLIKEMVDALVASGPHSGGIEVTVSPDEVAFLRINDVPRLASCFID